MFKNTHGGQKKITAYQGGRVQIQTREWNPLNPMSQLSTASSRADLARELTLWSTSSLSILNPQLRVLNPQLRILN